MQTINFPTNEIKPIEWEPYKGETVTTNIIIRKGKRTMETAYFEDRVRAIPSGNAYCIGNGPSRKGFDLTKLKQSGQTYGCNALYRDFMPDFIFSVDAQITMEMCKNEVGKKTIHYAPALEVNRKSYKGLLHLIPNTPHWISGNAAFWTAAVHGHKNIFLLGYDFREYGKNELNNIYQGTDNYGDRHSDDIFEGWLKQLRNFLKMRPYCNVTIVHDDPPEYLKHLQTGKDLGNSKIISYEQFNNLLTSR